MKSYNWIRGKTLISKDPQTLHAKYGTHIIHQSWKSETIPKAHEDHVLSWSKYHPEALHVLWTDEDNDSLISTHYPQYQKTYDQLVLTIQKCDLVRILYLHRYGGVYADLDYEAHQNIFKHLPKQADVMIVESPVLLNETMQNSLMISVVIGHPLWVSCADNIQKISSFINSPEECAAQKWGGCDMLKFFHNKLTKKIANMIYTLYISGPAVLDKTCVLNRTANWNLEILNKEQWFMGNTSDDGIATHHQANTWVSIGKNAGNLIAIFVGLALFLLGIGIGVTFLSVTVRLNHRIRFYKNLAITL
jgi:mannosyltransferase OCH1-like enzyme